MLFGIDDDVDDDDTQEERDEEDQDAESAQKEVVLSQPKQAVLLGHINTIRKGIAYLTLKDSIGRESFAEQKLSILKADGVTKKAGKFEIIISATDNIPSVTMRSDKWSRLLNRDEWAFMSETVAQTLSDNKMVEDHRYDKYKI